MPEEYHPQEKGSPVSTTDGPAPRTYALYVHPMEKHNRYASEQYVTFKATIVQLVPNESRGYGDSVKTVTDRGYAGSYAKPERRHLADLVIEASSSDRKPYADDLAAGRANYGDAYGYRVGYAAPYRVDLEDAEAMAYTLRTIDKGLRAIADMDGEARSFGQFAARVGRVLKLTRAARQSPHSDPPRGSRWDDYDLQFGSPGDAARWLDQQATEWSAEVRKLHTSEEVPA